MSSRTDLRLGRERAKRHSLTKGRSLNGRPARAVAPRGLLSQSGDEFTGEAGRGHGCYLAFLIKTTSDVEVPSVMTSLLSRDQSKENISSDLKLVIFFGSPPSID